MDLVYLLKIVVNRLEKLKTPYFLTGGLAVSFWGLPRTTHDIDIVIGAQKKDKEEILKIFKKDFYISEESVAQAIERRFTFNIIHYKSGLKIDFWLSKRNIHKTLEFKRKLKKKIFGKGIFIISPEDLILEKLLWYKESESSRHLEDVESILKISKVDLNYIKNWTEKQSTSEILKGVMKKNKGRT